MSDSYKNGAIRVKSGGQLVRILNDITAEILDDASNALTESMDEAALWATNELRATSMSHGWKHYYKGWTYERRGKRGNSVTVFNKSHYQLTHLLEKGHRIIRHDGTDTGKRTAAVPHIAPVNDQVPDKVDEFFNKKAKELGI